MTATCPECGETFRADDGGHAMDYLIDHLTDAHGLFEWATQGRPAHGMMEPDRRERARQLTNTEESR